MNGIRILWGMLFLLPWTVHSQAPPQDSIHLRTSPHVYDSIIARWKEDQITANFATYLQDYIQLDTSRYIPAVSTVTDTECKARLKQIITPIHLPYNDIIRKHIVAYSTTHRALTHRMLGYAKYYFPMIEKELDREGLPLELKFVAVLESSLNPMACSPGGPAGMWQLTLAAGRHYGLEISSLVDMRYDPVASTRAACLYMKDLYKIYNDWTLALASYNYGPGNVNKALQRAGTHASTYWDIYPYLPKVSRDYIPALVALIYIYHYHRDYGIAPGAIPLPLAVDTVMVTRKTDLNRVSLTLGIPSDLLRQMNPQFKNGVIPAGIKNYPLVLPQQEISRFLAADSIVYSNTDSAQDLLSTAQIKSNTGSQTGDGYAEPVIETYKVKSGDSLGSIAKKKKVTVKELMQWNNLSSSRLKIGQQLKIKR